MDSLATAGPPPLDDATPDDLRGLINFVNSRASARRPERFDTPAHATAFLAQCELGYDEQALSAQDTNRLRRLRDAIMHAIEDPADLDAWTSINDVAATTALHLHLHVDSGPIVSYRATHSDPVDAVIGRVLEQLATAINTRRWDRLGACARCRRVFYDNTRSHTRRWCSYATCGNRANVAAYRTRARP
jgi:predicted RNA-binding Zn ribbon-like protein